MCASATARGAIIGLRQSCKQWQKKGAKPKDIYTFRNLALAFLRLDLDLEGLEEYKFDDTSTWLRKLERDLQALEARQPSNKSL